MAEYAQLDAEDESLARWKASLGIAAGQATPGDPSKPKVSSKRRRELGVALLLTFEILGFQLSLHSLSLESQGAPNGKVTISLDNLNPTEMENLKKQPLTIKEGVEYNVAISFR